MRHLLILAAATVAAVATPGSADAYWWSGAGIGIGQLYRSLDFPTERRVPYFAARPPVYYSQPVPRTYGHSPFAYLPTQVTPEVIPTVKPVTVVNPYVQPSSVPAPKSRSINSQQTAPKARTISDSAGAEEPTEWTGPLTIINPFVVGEDI